MKFWRENKIDGEFELEATEVARQFVAFVMGPNGDEAFEGGQPVHRVLRKWLKSPEGLHAEWKDETGPESFETVLKLAHSALFD